MFSILVVDDNPLDRRLVRRELSRLFPGAHIQEAFNADQVSSALESGAIELVITDYQLRWSTGLDVLRESKTKLPNVPVIMFTNTGTEEVAVEGMKSGLDDYVLKAPGRYAELAQTALQTLRRHQEKLEQRRQEEARNRAKDDFLMMMAHELRGPLAPMSTALFLLKDETAAPESRTFALQTLERQVQHMSELVNDLLDVSRIISGRLRLQGEILDLRRLVSETVEDRRGEFAKTGVTLELSVIPASANVVGDRTRLRQVLGNLLDNALKFTPPGQGVKVVLDETPGGNVSVLVQDSGIGVEPEVLPRLFEPFVQADRSLARSAGGLGMGLAVVKRLIELHGGSVSARSGGPGLGAAFEFQLPRSDLAPGEPSQDRPTVTRHRGGRSVLIIEDYRDTAQMLSLLLQSQGYRVHVANTGEDGLQAAGAKGPDVVLCDLGLPDVSGYEVARRLKACPETAHVPIIAVSGYGHEQDRARALEAGFQEHMTKPVNPEALLGRLEAMWPAEREQTN